MTNTRTRHFRIAIAVCGALAPAIACSPEGSSSDALGVSEQHMVYGADDFRDAGNLDASDPWYARIRATTSLFRSHRVVCPEGSASCDLTTTPYQSGEVEPGFFEPLCSDERFAEQPSGSTCSGFLIAPDLVVTAGHCVGGPSVCAETKMVFGFVADEGATSDVSTSVPVDDVYSCSEIVARRYESSGPSIDNLDFAVLRLDRPVTDRQPVELRTTGEIALDVPVGVAGGYLGLPLKIAGGATVTGNSGTARFEANLDTGPGVSGGPVFNLDTGVVEGILVSGGVLSHKRELDENGENCARTYPCDEVEGCFADPADDHRDWVKVTRIEEVVKVLEGRSCFDGIMNGQETDVDCGGPECRACFPGNGCQEDSDCDSTRNCLIPYCDASQTCAVDSSTCECNEDSDCNDGVACTTDYCSNYSCFNLSTDDCECRFKSDCDDSDPCTDDSCSPDSYTCEHAPKSSCTACETDGDCGGPGTPSCVVPHCSGAGVCENDRSACECTDSSQCDDGVACTRDLCFGRTLSCIHIDEDCSEDCSEETALDLQGTGQMVTVPTDACLRVRDAYPSWWGTDRTLRLHSGSSGQYPVPFSWKNECANASGSGTFEANWQEQLLGPTSADCATLIHLGGDGSGSIQLQYWGQ